MRRAFLILLILLFTPCVFAQEDEKLPNIFIWSTPANIERVDVPDDKNADASENDYLTDEEVEQMVQEKNEKLLKAQEENSKKQKLSRKEKKAQEEAEQLKLVQVKDEDFVSATVLKGYAEYLEGTEEIFLSDDDQFSLNIRKPQTITTTDIDLKNSNFFESRSINFSKYTSDEYRISANNIKVRSDINNFAFGTSYDSEVSRSQLEQTAGFFAEYKFNKLSVATTFERYSGAMYGGRYYDTYSFIPTYKLNDNVSIKEVFGVDVTNSRKTAELVLQVSPLAHKGNDRLNFELGAKQYFDQTNAAYRTRFKFSTLFKL